MGQNTTSAGIGEGWSAEEVVAAVFRFVQPVADALGLHPGVLLGIVGGVGLAGWFISKVRNR